MVKRQIARAHQLARTGLDLASPQGSMTWQCPFPPEFSLRPLRRVNWLIVLAADVEGVEGGPSASSFTAIVLGCGASAAKEMSAAYARWSAPSP